MHNLKGFNVLVTRPKHQADGLCFLIEQLGGKAIRFPVIEILPVANPDRIRNTLKNLFLYDWVFFISRNAVNFTLRANNGKINLFKGVHYAAVGKATAEAMRSVGIRVDVMPGRGFNSEALLMEPDLQKLEGLSCLIIRGQDGREYLADTLRDRGGIVEYLQVYKRSKPTTDVQPVVNLLRNKALDAITITSVEGLKNLIESLGETMQSCILSIPLIVVSTRIMQQAKDIGFIKVAVSEEPSDAAMIKTITELLNEEKSG